MAEPAREHYPIQSRMRGDNGTPAPHLAIRCFSCGERDWVPLTAGAQPPAAVTNQVFRHRGWLPGRTRTKDLCPECDPHAHKARGGREAPQIALNRAVVQPNPTRLLAGTLAPAKCAAPTVAAAAPLVPPPPVVAVLAEEIAVEGPAATGRRDPSRHHRRRILDELWAVYDEDIGYKADASDATVASKLDVPRVWVTEIRDDFFGPHTNEAQRHLQSELQRLIGLARDVEVRALSLGTDAENLRQQVNRLLDTAPRGIG